MQDIQELNVNLLQQLDQLEANHRQIGDGIIEVQRRIGILDEAMSWSPVEIGVHQELTQEEFPGEDNLVEGGSWEEADLWLSQEHEFFNAEAELAPVEL